MRVSVVTAAGGDIGRAVASSLVAEGHRLVLADVSGNRLDATVAMLRDQGAECEAVRADVSERAGAEAVCARAEEAGGGADVLVNVVGGYRGPLYESVFDLSDDRFDDVWRRNLRSTFLLTRGLGRGMVERGWGRIVNISSVAKDGAAGQADYAAAKAAVVGFTRSCALEFAPSVTVNAVAPGLIRTRVFERLDEGQLDRFRERIPGGEPGTPADVAATVRFLVSEDAGYVTGDVIHVSGGFFGCL